MRYLIILILSILLVGCDNQYPPKPPPNTGRYVAVINPHPQYFMTVQGHIDPQLNNQVKLVLFADYSTTNDSCKYVINWFEGVSSPRPIDKVIHVSPDINGYYKYQIPMDYYFPGFCGWEFDSIHYNLTGKTDDYDAYPLYFLSRQGKASKYKIGEYDWICSSGEDCTVYREISLVKDFENNVPLSSKANYIINFNLKAHYGNSN